MPNLTGICWQAEPDTLRARNPAKPSLPSDPLHHFPYHFPWPYAHIPSFLCSFTLSCVITSVPTRGSLSAALSRYISTLSVHVAYRLLEALFAAVSRSFYALLYVPHLVLLSYSVQGLLACPDFMHVTSHTLRQPQHTRYPPLFSYLLPLLSPDNIVSAPIVAHIHGVCNHHIMSHL